MNAPLPSNRHHRSNGDCLEGNYRPNSSLDWVLSHWAHFTLLRLVFVYVLHACVGLYHGEVDLVGLKPILRTTTSFSALTL